MTKLTAKTRNALPGKDFALPGGRYPIEDKSHARNALARVSQHGTPAEKAKIRAKVEKKYPGIHQEAGQEIERRLAKRDR